MARRVLGWIGYGLLGLVALVGVVLAAVFFVFTTPSLSGRLVVPRILPLVNGAIQGKVELASLDLLAIGGVEIKGARVLDPEGHAVLSAERLRVELDLARLFRQTVGLEVELDGLDALLERNAEGQLSLARAFAPKSPGPKSASGPFTWTIRIPRLVVRRAAARQIGAKGEKVWALTGIEARGRALYAADRAGVDLSVEAAMTAPAELPLSLELFAGLREKDVRVRALRLAAGKTSLEAVAEVNLESLAGRAAILSLKVDEGELGRLAPQGEKLASDLEGTLYAESDGELATLAMGLTPRGGDGRARLAAAGRLPPAALALGADLHLEKLDLAQVLDGAPPSALTLDARAHAAGGTKLAELVGAVKMALAPSRLRSGTFGPADLEASADRGAFTLSRLSVEAPGLELEGKGAWGPEEAVKGHATLVAKDLAALRENLAGLLGRELPPVEGSASLEANLTGTEEVPALSARLTAPRVAAAGVRVSEADLTLSAKGPLSQPSGELQGKVAEVAKGADALRSVKLSARVEGREGEVSLRAAVPQLGSEAVAVEGAGALAEDRQSFTLSALSLAWPEAKFALAKPAHVDLGGPSVDRLELVSAPGKGGTPQRLAVSGGLRMRSGVEELDARLEVTRLDLGALPKALLPPDLGLAGRFSLDATAAGRTSAPDVVAEVKLEELAAKGVSGLDLSGKARYDGGEKRARFDLDLSRREGGELSAKGDLPVALAKAPRSSPLSLDLSLKGVRVAEALRLARQEMSVAVDGKAAIELHLAGTVGSPAVTAEASLSDGTVAGIEGLDLSLKVKDPGRELRLTGTLDRSRSRVVDADVKLPLDLAALLRAPGAASKALAKGSMTATVAVPGLDLATLAGRFGVPPEAKGVVTARIDLAGPVRAPRGKVTVALEKGAFAGYRELAAKVALAARADATAVNGSASMGGDEVLRFEGSLALPVEELATARQRERAALTGRLDVLGVDLSRAGSAVPLGGMISGEAVAKGSLAEPDLTANFAAKKLVISGHPLGDAKLQASAQGHAAKAELHLEVASGGTLDGKVDVEADERLAALRLADVKKAQTEVTLTARALDLGVLPALAPGTVRSASGTLDAHLEAKGPLGKLRPKGHATIDGGKIAVTEWGDWTDLALRLSITDQALQVDKLHARRGEGSVDLTASVQGLDRKDQPAGLKASLKMDKLGIPRNGQLVATVDLDAGVTGQLGPQKLEAEVKVSSAVIKLPDKLPRQVQSLAERDDIVVRPFTKGPPKGSDSKVANQLVGPFRAVVHVLAPSRFQIKAGSPTVDLDLRADVTVDWRTNAPLGISGNVLTQRGRIEVQGRNFEVKRGRVDFTGAGYEAANLDIKALYDNPQAKVTVSVQGTVQKPEVKLTSDPPLDEGQIAFLLATGRTELKPGGGGVSGSSFSAESVTNTALGALSGFFVKDVLGDKLPVDTVEASSSRIRAGKYLSDKAYVGYTRNMNARPEQGENTNEVSLQYQISQHWNFEARVGDAGSGGASLIWSKDY